MKNPIDHISESAQQIRLSEESKSRIRGVLESHIRLHPAAPPAVFSPYTRFLGILSPLTTLRVPAAAFALVLILAVGSASAYAAEGALPGDALYPLKVSVIEPAQGLLAVTPEAKTEWSVSLTEKRLKEAEQLSASSRLTENDSAEIQVRLSESLEAAHENIKKIAEKDPEAGARVGEALSVSLDAHATIIENLGLLATTSEKTQAVTGFARYVRKEAEHGRPQRAPLPHSGDNADTHDSDEDSPQKPENDSHHNTTSATTTTSASTTLPVSPKPSPLIPVNPITPVPISGSGGVGGGLGI